VRSTPSPDRQTGSAMPSAWARAEFVELVDDWPSGKLGFGRHGVVVASDVVGAPFELVGDDGAVLATGTVAPGPPVATTPSGRVG